LDSDLFAAEIFPIFSAFLDSNQNSLTQLDSPKSIYFTESTKSRRQSPQVQQLAKMIGKNSKLYDSVLQILRLRFFDQKAAHFGSLRGELLMALHDAECTELLQLDPCHKYAWCLDAWLKEYQLNVKQCKELEIVLDGVRRGQDTVMADLALISADPRTMHLFGHLCIRMLQQCVEKEQQPRDNQGNYFVWKRLRTEGQSRYLLYGPRDNQGIYCIEKVTETFSFENSVENQMSLIVSVV
jgi:negative elongation factor B